jgi:hypothetical protein
MNVGFHWLFPVKHVPERGVTDARTRIKGADYP